MQVGDKVKIRTGKRGMPPRGEVVEVLPDGKVRVKRRGVVEEYDAAALVVV